MTAGKHAVIVRAATELFLRQGFRATSTEQIAAAAAVSKQTVYTRFGDKESLFREVVLAVAPTAEAFAADLTSSLVDAVTADEVEAVLRAVARRYLAAVMDPQVLALRRLVIGEAARFPEVAAAYYARSPAMVLAALAREFGRLAERGLVTLDDPRRAADDFAFLLLGRPLDHGMFHATPEIDIAEAADHAVDVFLAAHRVGL
ncbi:TetR/AcrR family transcriptional regulator [Actinomycetospora sp. CA-101289]|uniref:TetR/AcrR family transcriptional regulator n=1 Tax=Actinomycetospora sp. CA-101289 TaxID=3239893 RepID=UPI003D996DDA